MSFFIWHREFFCFSGNTGGWLWSVCLYPHYNRARSLVFLTSLLLPALSRSAFSFLADRREQSRLGGSGNFRTGPNPSQSGGLIQWLRLTVIIAYTRPQSKHCFSRLACAASKGHRLPAMASVNALQSYRPTSPAVLASLRPALVKAHQLGVPRYSRLNIDKKNCGSLNGGPSSFYAANAGSRMLFVGGVMQTARTCVGTPEPSFVGKVSFRSLPRNCYYGALLSPFLC